MITIKDVARQARVSPATVSNALTGKRAVAAPTRQRILDVVDRLGYQPNLLGRSLVNQRSESIGVVIYDDLSYANSLIASGIMQETNQLGYTMTMTALHKLDKATATEAISSLVARKVDGIIWAVPEIGRSNSWISDKQPLQMPPLMIIANEPRPGSSVVVTNNYGGSLKATQHL